MVLVDVREVPEPAGAVGEVLAVERGARGLASGVDLLGFVPLCRTVEVERLMGGVTGRPGVATSDVWVVVVVVVCGGSMRLRTNRAGVSITRKEVTATFRAVPQPARIKQNNPRMRAGEIMRALVRSFLRSDQIN